MIKTVNVDAAIHASLVSISGELTSALKTPISLGKTVDFLTTLYHFVNSEPEHLIDFDLKPFSKGWYSKFEK